MSILRWRGSRGAAPDPDLIGAVAPAPGQCPACSAYPARGRRIIHRQECRQAAADPSINWFHKGEIGHVGDIIWF